MRNLKRALSLVLTAAMISGLMVMGTSAVSYPDSDEIQNQTAVEILGEIGVMVGDDNGNFNPTQDVTRAEMAVIITRILYGNDLNVDQFKGMNLFTDVPAWAEGFVNLCASLDIVAGVGDGKFAPNETVTAAQAALMLSRALGYFQNNAEFGNDWALAAIRRATSAGIIGDDMVLAANEGLSRDNVAQMTFNTLTKAVPVQYNELLNVYYNQNQGITYSLTFYYTDTLGYQNFDLVYRSNDRGDYGRPSTTWGTGYYMGGSGTSTSGNDEYDLNEDGSLRPERVRMLEEDEIITVSEEPTYVYTEATKENAVYKDLGRSLVENNDWTWEAYVDGEEQVNPVKPANDKDTTYLYTSDGATTEVYVDAVNQEVTIVKINYYMGEVTDIREDEDGEYATVRVLSQETNETVNGLSDVVNIRDIYCEGFAEDDYVMITVDVNDDDDSYVKTIEYPETVEGTVSRVDEDSDPEDSDGGYVRLAGDDTKYEYSTWTASDLDDINVVHPTLDAAYRLYLDPNGFVIGFIATENIYDNYLYIEEASEYLGTIEALATFADGVSKRITIDDEWVNGAKINKSDVEKMYTAGGLEGGAYAYTVSDDVYTLRQILDIDATRPTGTTTADMMYRNYRDVADDVTAADDAQIENGVAYITVGGEKYIVDKNTQFVDVEEGTVYVGYENVPDYITTPDNVVEFWAIDTRETNGVLDVVFIYNGESSNDNKTYFYVPDENAYESYDRDGMYKGLECYIDGEDASLDFTAAAFDEVRTNKVGLYVVNRTNADGYVTDCDYLGDGRDVNGHFNDVVSVGDGSFSLMVNNDRLQWTTNDETVFVTVTYDLKKNSYSYEDADVTVGKLSDMKQNETYDINAYVAKPSDSDDPAELVYIVREELVALDNTITFTGDTADYTVTNIDVDDGYVSGAYTIEVNDGEDVTFTIKPADGKTITSVTGAALVSGNTYRITDIQTDVTVDVQIDEIKDMYTLTLMGDYADVAHVYANRGSALTGTPITGDYGATVGYRFGPFAEGTEITVEDSSITVADGVYTVDGIEVTVDGTNDRLTFDITADTTLQTAPVAGNARYTVTASDGITLYDEDGNKLTGTVAVTAGTDLTVESETGTYFTKAAGEDSKAISGSPTSDSTALDVTGNLIVYAATQVNLNNVVATYDRADGAQDVPTGRYVAMGTKLTVAPVANQGTGVITGDYGQNIEKYTVGEDGGSAVTLNAAVQVNANDGIAVKHGTTDVTGQYVKVGENVTVSVPATAGTAAIDLASNTDNRHSSTGTANGGSLSVSTSNIDLYAAVSISFNGTPDVWYYVDNNVDVHIDAGDYVLPDTKLYTDKTNTVTYNGVTVDTTTVGDYIYFTVENHGVTITAS